MSIGKVNFWEIYPDAEIIEIFRELRKSKGDSKSSDLLWYIHCLKDPENVFMRHLPDEERKAELKKYYKITEAVLKEAQVKKVFQWYETNWLTAPERLLNALETKLYQAEDLMSKAPMKKVEDIGLYSDIQKQFSQFKKAHDESIAAVKNQESTKRKVGGGKLSAADDGTLFD